MGLRCWLGWHDWKPMTSFRFISPISLMRIEEHAERKFPDVIGVPVRLEQCVVCGDKRGRASTPTGVVHADLAYVEYVMTGWDDESIDVRDPEWHDVIGKDDFDD